MGSPLHSLLELQRHDTAADQHAHRRAALPERDELATAQADLAAVDADIARVRDERDALGRRQKHVEDDVATVESKARAEDARLYSGTVTAAKELQAIQDEIEALQRRQRALEDDVLELMVQTEPLDAELATLEQRRASIVDSAQAVSARIASIEAEIDAELAEVAAERAAVAATIASDVLDEYEALRSRLGGIAVAKLEAGSCRGCHLQLPAVEIDRIKKVPSDEVVHCDECGRILVR